MLNYLNSTLFIYLWMSNYPISIWLIIFLLWSWQFIKQCPIFVAAIAPLPELMLVNLLILLIMTGWHSL